ncbi:MAG TPA: ABC transporter ATP-binding protein [Thermotogota bacterium]|nr:ABC transporter ATP-binding protein [Thermotogota bacterium]
MIIAENLKKIYKNGSIRIMALSGISLHIKKGEIVSILGPSGCGKSTLLNCLSAIDEPDEGTIKIDKCTLNTMNDNQKTKFRAEKMGFIFQSYNLIPVLNAVENVEMALLTQKEKRKNTLEKSVEVLKQVGLGERIYHYPNQMSGGECQRVSIARALVHNPEIIWADEPTGALDTETGLKIMDLILYLNKEFQKTFVIVTHDERIAQFSSRILRMDSGRLS